LVVGFNQQMVGKIFVFCYIHFLSPKFGCGGVPPPLTLFGLYVRTRIATSINIISILNWVTQSATQFN
ncbi:MAG: hypothetical protein ACK59W_16465, partial [Pseudanabaena sp.]